MTIKTLTIASLLALAALAGCTAPTTDDGDGTEQGQVAFYVKDAPGDEFESVFVAFTKVQVHKTGDEGSNATTTTAATNATAPTNATATNTTAPANTTTPTTSAASEAGWITIFEGNESIDLKAFQGDARAFLGDANITTGKYTQIRITVTEVYGMSGSNRTNITLPSGTLKVVGNFDVEADQVTLLTVDFELDKSLHMAGQKYMFKPTMKLMVEHKGQLDSSDTQEPSAAANANKGKGGKPTDKGKPGATTNTTASS